MEKGFDLPGARWEAGHRGVDLAGHPGQSVLAPVAGTVSYVGKIAGRGVVTLSHGETRTTYEPVLSDLSVGAEVVAGEGIGWLHPTGSHCAPGACLHWGWRRGSDYLDPMDLVGQTRMRLLPLWGSAPKSAIPFLAAPALLRHPWEFFTRVGAPERRPS